MSIIKKKVILPLLLLSIFLISQTAISCYAATAGTWNSFTQSFGATNTVYTQSFVMNNGVGISAYPTGNCYKGTVKVTNTDVKVTVQQYDSVKGWTDYESTTVKNGSVAIFNSNHSGTFRCKIVYDSSVTTTSSTVLVQYFT